MKGVTKIQSITCGLSVKIIGATSAFNSFVDAMPEYVGDTRVIDDVYGGEMIAFRMVGSGLYYARTDFDIEGDTPCISESKIRPGTFVQIGKELASVSVAQLTDRYFGRNRGLGEKYQMYDDYNTDLYDKTFYIVNDSVYYKHKKLQSSWTRNGDIYEIVVGLIIDGKLAYVPHTCLFEKAPNYNPRIIERKI